MTLRLFHDEQDTVTDHYQHLYLIDLHVHTSRFSPCAETLDPERIASFARDRGLNGVVLTEHDYLWTEQDIRILNDNPCGIRFYKGVEVSAREGHFLVIGLDDLKGIQKGITTDHLIMIAKDHEAAVILPHPHLMQAGLSASAYGKVLEKRIDAIEVISTVTTSIYHKSALSLSGKYRHTAVGGSDAHALSFVGRAFSVFDTLPDNEKELAKSICRGKVQAGAFEDDR